MLAKDNPESRLPDDGFDDSSEDISTNPTDNVPFREVAKAHFSRRHVLQGSLAAAVATYLAPAPAYGDDLEVLDLRNKPTTLLDFEPLTIADATAAEGKMITVSPDYEYQVLIPWGTPIDPMLGVTEYEGDPNTRPTAAEQEQMVGIGHDGMWLFPLNLRRVLRVERKLGKELEPEVRRQALSNTAGMMCINHEFGRNSHVLGKSGPESLEDVRLSQAAHGVSVIAVQRGSNGRWRNFSNKNNRRITVNTEVEFGGPVAHSDLIANPAANTYRGTVNNCGSGPTPWGTYLTCEENFNGYFGSTRMDAMFGGFNELQDIAYGRYGFSAFGFGYGWQNYDERFDLSNPDYANESNRFGWVVEIDPFDGTSKAVKRTALGRFKHESAAVKELEDGRVAVYMGDDQRGDYCYKFESRKPWRDEIDRGLSPLDRGKLYVAKFGSDRNGDGKGKGRWIELTIKNTAIWAAGLRTQEQVLTYARLAADAVGATPMDRPEWSTIGKDGEVFWTLTNNDRKDDLQGKLSESNPIFENRDGYIISTKDINSRRFEWSMFAIARNSRRADDPATAADDRDFPYAAYTPPADGGANVYTDPDAAYADPYGRLYIGTDGGQPDGLQDQLLVFDTYTGEYKRLLMGVNSDEITGITFTPDHETLFTNTQHAGDGDPTRTNFPAEFDGVTIPRDATIVVSRKKNTSW